MTAPLSLAREQPRLGPVARRLAALVAEAGAECELVFPDGEAWRCGAGAPAFRVLIRSPKVLRRPFDEFSLGRAYVEGEIDIEGDFLALLDLRRRLGDRLRVGPLLRFLSLLFLTAPTRANRASIADHYSFGDDFYHSFIDRRHRFYSHGIFHSAAESIEEASEHKLETMWRALELRPGMHLLDIGGGWGGVTRYCAPRGVRVTSLTLAPDSRRYIQGILDAEALDGEVLLEDFLEHRPERPYDAAVIYGVIEHLPNYRRFCARAWELLRPGGRLYMDASASKEKYLMSAFTRHYIWHGTHTFLCLQDIVQELLFHGFELLEVHNESRDYEWTMRQWAERFDAARAAIAERWGEKVYRAFRVYLWGGCHAFQVDRLQAYHLTARRGEGPGPRPGLLRRGRNFVRGLA
jgi:cyclopropane-fatty-acyl-phospholipid synthase